MVQLNIAGCTGCGACSSICSQNAISMQENDEGFLYPKIDNSKCIACGLCEKICPILNNNCSNAVEPESFAVMANDETRAKSSSGGVFPILANYIIDNGGYVVGAIWQNRGVKHIVSNLSEDIKKMRGSKYIQSIIGECYLETKRLLVENKKVLFTGTPCQIAGLKAFLRKDYDNLFTVEIICHGVPSPKVFRKYLEEMLDNDETFIETNFRNKVEGWSTKSIITTKTNKKNYSIAANKDNFMQAFLKNLCLRKSCGDCQFNKIPRQADLTIGDFWEIDKYNKKYNDQKGTSVLLINNEKGKNLINSVSKNFKLFKNVPIKYAIKGNPNLIRSSVENNFRNRFFNTLKTDSLDNAVQAFAKNDCDYLLVNFWDSYNNYGALLTAYALQELIRSYGFKTKFLDTGERTILSRYKDSFGQNFVSKFLYKTQVLKFKQAMSLTKNVKGVVLGSDQILRIEYIRQAFNKYLLKFVDNNCKKIAFSASFGLDKEDFLKDKFSTRKNISRIKKELASFDYLSSREISGVEIFLDVFGLESKQILDPVFLIPKDCYNEILSDSTIDYSNKVVTYVLDENEEYKKIYKELSDRDNLDVVELYIQESLPDVSNFLNAIKTCKYLITDSFHGVCFALIFNKPFIALKNKRRGSSRFDSLCKMFNLEASFVDSIENILQTDVYSVNYKKFNNSLKNEQVRCLKEIEKVLFDEKLSGKNKLSKNKIQINKNLLLHCKILLYKIQSVLYKNKRCKYVEKIKMLKHRIEWQ